MTEQTPQQHLKSALLAGQEWWADMGVETPPVPASAKAKPKTKTAAKPVQKATGPPLLLPVKSRAKA